jgi:MFS family permease
VFANIAGFAVFLLVPYYLITYQQGSAVAGGLLLAVAPLGAVIASPISGWCLQRLTSYRLSLGGILLMTVGLASISRWHGNTSVLGIAGSLWLQGFGLGLFQVANMDFVMGTIPRFQQGVAGSLTTLTRTLGVIACATLGAVVFGWLQAYYTSQLSAAGVAVVDSQTQAFLPAFQWVFRGAAVVAALTYVVMWGSRWVVWRQWTATSPDHSLTRDTNERKTGHP